MGLRPDRDIFDRKPGLLQTTSILTCGSLSKIASATGPDFQPHRQVECRNMLTGPNQRTYQNWISLFVLLLCANVMQNSIVPEFCTHLGNPTGLQLVFQRSATCMWSIHASLWPGFRLGFQLGTWLDTLNGKRPLPKSLFPILTVLSFLSFIEFNHTHPSDYTHFSLISF